MLINRANLAVVKAVSEKHSRYANMLVCEDGTVATDGEILAHVSLNSEVGLELFPGAGDLAGKFTVDNTGSLQLNAKTAKAIAKALPKKSTIPVLQYGCVGRTAEGKPAVATNDLETAKVFEAMVDVPGEFSNWKAVLPREAPKFRIALDARLLRKLLDVVIEASNVDSNKRPVRVELLFHDHDKAMELKSKAKGTDQQTYCLIMPMSASTRRLDD